MSAVVVTPFPGVKDGETNPTHFVEGDVIDGDLAETALRYGLAVQEGSEGADTAGAGDGGGKVIVVDGQVEIPENWPKLKWFALKALAEKILGKPVAGTDEARNIVQAEVDRRANPETSEAGVAGAGGDVAPVGQKEGGESQAGAGSAQADAGGKPVAGTDAGAATAG
ncbi:hypothetical protein HAP47_0022700 [Bradyrhizobium sp. 41S5]|uniref:hypothetical protein n=1 Tax=Bradyrhizobium sp. 41S5 TaxID=1404443 RepID=UPI00156A86B1|nr:hypothetical protein [Bradyrhizobium sp. 41S5]UFX42073.1 hypothetical protein HAP47_0022700 [Bradyrhizobium sp. 41S5]